MSYCIPEAKKIQQRSGNPSTADASHYTRTLIETDKVIKSKTPVGKNWG
ncbi:hypothetical protein [Robertkochia flava]|nr:hypothetical protein [Robertkochia marina]